MHVLAKESQRWLLYILLLVFLSEVESLFGVGDVRYRTFFPANND